MRNAWPQVSGVLILTLVIAALLAADPPSPINANGRLHNHPRMLLNGEMLARLRARAAANSPEWNSLKARCDAVAQMPVLFFDQSGTGLGEGYQGGEYFNAVMSLGLCRYSVMSSDAASSRRYGLKMVDILRKMSDPARSPDPRRDNGYGIRFYGVGMAYGYDWAYDLLDTATKAQVWRAINRWLKIFETDPCCDWEWEHPQSNYFASYYHAKAVGAIATEGDNPSAPVMWDDWIHDQHEARVQPFFAINLAGGGWPEGFPNYGPLAVLNHSLVTMDVLDAKGIDLIHAGQPYRFPLETADYLMHFTWPSLTFTDDRGAAHAVKEGQAPAGVVNATMFTSVAGILRYWNAPHAAVFQQYAEKVLRQAGMASSDAWQRFLLWDANAPKAALDTLPRSYFARGLNHVSARSDWSTGATWLSFVSGTYINNPSQGEQMFDEGSLALVHGGTPLLVNAGAWLMHNSSGTQDGEAGEKSVYRANYGKFKQDATAGNRDLYSIFYSRRLDQNGVPAEPYGQGAYGPGEAGTRISSFEDSGSYVLAIGSKLEDMYRRTDATKLVDRWTRQVLYLRPKQVIVYDETAVGDAAFDQFMAWTFPAKPSEQSAGHRLDISFGSTFAGSMTAVLPEGAHLASTDLFHAGKVWRVDVRPAASGARQRWLTVFDLSSTPGAVARATPVSLTEGRGDGVSLQSPDGDSVAIFCDSPLAAQEGGKLVYRVSTSPAEHFVSGLSPEARYGVSVSSDGDQYVVTVSPGRAFAASRAGVLAFHISATGTVEPAEHVNANP